MSPPDANAVDAACRTLLGPIASFLLKCGLNWRQFSAISKSVFVEVASREYGLNGRPTNTSRVAILTGIGRKDVKKLRQLQGQPSRDRADKSTGATAVLAGWHQDADFLDADGKPHLLSVDTGERSFVRLCERYAGDIPAIAMLKELRRVGAIATEAGMLRVISRSYAPGNSDPQWVRSAAQTLSDLGDNLSYNLDAADEQPSRFLGRAMNSRIKASAVPAFHDFLEEHGQAFLEKIDDWLADNAADPGSEEPQVRLGVGLFAIEGNGELDEEHQHG